MAAAPSVFVASIDLLDQFKAPCRGHLRHKQVVDKREAASGKICFPGFLKGNIASGFLRTLALYLGAGDPGM